MDDDQDLDDVCLCGCPRFWHARHHREPCDKCDSCQAFALDFAADDPGEET